MKAVTSDFIRHTIPVREKWSHKGDSGRLLIIGGSRRYRGAPALCGLAALRTGVDLVTIAAPETTADVIASFSPNLITEPLEGDYINPGNLDKLAAMSRNFDALVIGNGMGRMTKSMDTLVGLLKALDRPCVIDADALHMLAGNRKVLRKGWVITPHEKEFYSISGVKISQKLDCRVRQAEKFSSEFRVTVLLKGHKDVISEGRTSYVNSTGNPFMTVGGTGDVLAGICGAFLAMGVKPLDAAAAAAYLCGSAGDIAARHFGPGLLATDVIEKIPEAIRNAVEFADIIR